MNCAAKARAGILGKQWYCDHMEAMRAKARAVLQQKAVDRWAKEAQGLTPTEAFRVGWERGRKAGYIAGVRVWKTQTQSS